MMLVVFVFFFYCYGDHRDLNVLTHSFPTRRSSDLKFASASGKSPARPRLDSRHGDRSAPDCRRGDAPASGRADATTWHRGRTRSEEHTSALQSLMRISYAVFCLKKNTQQLNSRTSTHHASLHPNIN